MDATHVEGPPTFVITVEHKNADATTWTTAGSFSNITATGVASKDLSGLQEESRFKCEFSTGTDGAFVHFMMSPAWRALYPGLARYGRTECAP